MAAYLRDHAHQHTGGGNHAVPLLDARLAALAQGEGGAPVVVGPGGDLGGLKDKVPPPLPQVQQVPEQLVLLQGLLALPNLLLQLGVLLLQVADLLLHLPIVEDVAGHPLHPVSHRRRPIAHRGGDGGHQVGQGIGVAPHKGGGDADEDAEQQGNHQKPDAVPAQKILHALRSFSAARRRGSTPNRARILPSRHTGRPTTLK